MIYGAALVVALIAGAAAILDRVGEPPPRARTNAASSTSTKAPVQPAEPDFVPDLPSVPDLATEPPPARPQGDEDPRMEALTVEMRMLSHAREQLEEHPGEAYSILEQHRRQHPHGILREEREAFAIEALVSLEQREQAERRYYDFVREYPSSDFTARLASLLR